MERSSAPAPAEVQDTVRYTVIRGAEPAGERLAWAEPDGSSGFFSTSPFRRTSLLTTDADGLPVRLTISGRKNPFQPWQEEFDREGRTARWSTTVDEGQAFLRGPAYYLPIYPVHDLGVLARALLRQPAHTLKLLPAGEARLHAIEERVASMNGRRRTVRLYAIDGIDLKRGYVWLDDGGQTFADESSILAGWEPAFPPLRAAIDSAIADAMRIQAEAVVSPARERPLVIRNVRLFDPTTLGVTEAASIVIDGDRIRAVIGAPDTTRALSGAVDLIDAAGLTALPGLWDMHAHHDPARMLHVYAPFHLAAGVTATRDMGSDGDLLVAFRDRIERGEAIGPRIVMAGSIDGVGGSRTGVQVADSAQAVAAVDRYAEMGFVQIKIFNGGELPAELVRVVIDRARGHGVRVSGHVPWAMTARAAVEAGFDELQHMTSIMEGVVLEPDEDVNDAEIARRLAGLRPESQAARDFVALLVREGVAVDPTLAFFYAAGTVPPRHMVGEIDRFPQPLRRQRLVTSPPQWAGSRWNEILANMSGLLRAFHEAGVPLLPGTDATPGFALHEELELYVKAGIPAREVLALATIGAARVMGMDEELGSIEAGKLADLILVDGDPTTDIADIRRVVTVIKDGHVFDPARIYALFGIRPCCT